MAALNATAKNLMLEALAAVVDYASLHDDAAGAAGDNEITGGSYARKAVTWETAALGVLAMDVDPSGPVFDVPASTTVDEVGLWDHATTGAFYGSADVDDEVFTNAGTYTVTEFEITASDPA